MLLIRLGETYYNLGAVQRFETVGRHEEVGGLPTFGNALRLHFAGPAEPLELSHDQSAFLLSQFKVGMGNSEILIIDLDKVPKGFADGN